MIVFYGTKPVNFASNRNIRRYGYYITSIYRTIRKLEPEIMNDSSIISAIDFGVQDNFKGGLFRQ